MKKIIISTALLLASASATASDLSSDRDTYLEGGYAGIHNTSPSANGVYAKGSYGFDGGAYAFGRYSYADYNAGGHGHYMDAGLGYRYAAAPGAHLLGELAATAIRDFAEHTDGYRAKVATEFGITDNFSAQIGASWYDGADVNGYSAANADVRYDVAGTPWSAQMQFEVAEGGRQNYQLGGRYSF